MIQSPTAEEGGGGGGWRALKGSLGRAVCAAEAFTVPTLFKTGDATV